MLDSWNMKKLFRIIVLNFLLIINISEAKILDVGNGIAIDIPKNYKYFEINYKKLNDLLVTFPNLKKFMGNKDFKEGLKLFGIGNNSKLTILVENQEALKLVKKLSTLKGINEIIKEFEVIMAGPLNEYLDEAFTPDLQKKLQEIPAEKQEEFVNKWFEEPAQVKFLEKLANDTLIDFAAKHKIHKYIIVFTTDKKIENYAYNKLQTIGTSQCVFNFKCKNYKDLQKLLKKELPNWASQSPLYKGTNYSFKFNETEIGKNSNNNLFLYTQFNMKDSSNYNISGEFFASIKNEKIILANSNCIKKCKNYSKIVNEMFESTGMLKKN